MSKNINIDSLFNLFNGAKIYALYGETRKNNRDETLIILEERKILEEAYILDHRAYLAPEIKERLNLNGLFTEVLTKALSEIIDIVEEIGKIKYIIEVSTEVGYELPKLAYTVVTIKTPTKDSKSIIHLWKIIEEKVREKIKLINADIEEINKISRNIVISIEILE